jgi:small subunit ribosomal protein S6
MGPLRPKEVTTTSNYEIMLLLNPEAEAERRTEILDRITKTATDGGGSVEKVDEWGKKRLAYEIDHIRDAFYYVITLTAAADVLGEIARILKITDEVIRFMPVSLKETVTSSKVEA